MMSSWSVYFMGVCAVLIYWIGAAHSVCKVDEIPVMENFDMTQMMGVWYETYWAPPQFEKPEEVWYDYAEVWSPTEEPDRVVAKAHGRPIDSMDCGTFDKTYVKSESSESAKWWSPRYINASYSFPMDQWIIGTNYTSWSLVYGCTLTHAETGTCEHAAAWVWSRTQTLSTEDKAAVGDLLPSVCLTFDDLNEMPIGEECERTTASRSSVSSLASRLLMFCLLLTACSL